MESDLRIFEFKTEIKNYTFLFNFEIFKIFKINHFLIFHFFPEFEFF